MMMMVIHNGNKTSRKQDEEDIDLDFRNEHMKDERIIFPSFHFSNSVRSFDIKYRYHNCTSTANSTVVEFFGTVKAFILLKSIGLESKTLTSSRQMR